MTARDPETREEWQEAADAASLMLAIDSAVQYGLVAWSGAEPDNVNVDRCVELLDRARAMGITPAPLSILLKRGRLG